MGPDKPLPYNDTIFNSADDYVNSLLDFVGTNDLLRTLCGGVHLLDFFTSDPDLYSRILPQEWRDFFARDEFRLADFLDLFMREDLDQFSTKGGEGEDEGWRGGPVPPASLIEYLKNVRKHLLDREIRQLSQCAQNRTQKKLARIVSVGMSVKKVHEVGLYAAYVDSLATSLQDQGHEISHLIDFGSGQSYLGRALASAPYNRNIVAIESKSHNAERAKDFDIKARIVEKQRVMRNKKAHRAGEEEPALAAAPPRSERAKEKWPDVEREDAVQYVDHRILDGDLSDVISRINQSKESDGKSEKHETNAMVMSLHSCGNLVHHGLRSLILNPSVKAVALVGCCYNLLTERLGPATYKLPELRPTTHLHPRLRNGDSEEEPTCDPHGFPMSERLCSHSSGSGVRLNITARMMAVQAPQNWGKRDSEAFFTRHFYRALLQRLFLDKGVVGPPSTQCSGGSPIGHSSKAASDPGGGPVLVPGGGPSGTPITIGSLRKGCYDTFPAYVRGALHKLSHPEHPTALSQLLQQRVPAPSDAELEDYEARYRRRKRDLSIIWSLMAFSAGVIESAIVVDRWLWLREQEGVAAAWVENVFEFGVSPRNLVVVGVKR